jgi:hypothetical protein
MPTSQTLEALRNLAYEPATHAACYKARRLLDALPHPHERAEAERYLLGVWGEPNTTLQRLIERHAFGLALGGVDLSEPRFTQGPFTFHVYTEDEPMAQGEVVGDDHDLTVLPEPRRLDDLQAVLADLTPDALAAAFDGDAEAWAELDEDERLNTLLDEHPDEFNDLSRTLFPCFARADTVEDLLRHVRDLHLVDFGSEDDDDDDDARDPQDDARFRAIEDPALRRFARELHGEAQLMGLAWELEALYYCRIILLRRPTASLVCGWDAIPHRQSEGWAILRWG